MSSLVTAQHAEELSTGARQLGVTLTEGQHQQLLAYLALLIKWNKAYNLTAVRNPDEMVSRHLLASLRSYRSHLADPTHCCTGIVCSGSTGDDEND